MATSSPTTTNDLSMVLPRVLIVSRRTVRKNKFVDFVGEIKKPTLSVSPWDTAKLTHAKITINNSTKEFKLLY
jgi:hypothetical protein